MVFTFLIFAYFFYEFTYFAADEHLDSKHLASGIMNCVNPVELDHTVKVLSQLSQIFIFYVAFINKEFLALFEEIMEFHLDKDICQFKIINILQSLKQIPIVVRNLLDQVFQKEDLKPGFKLFLFNKTYTLNITELKHVLFLNLKLRAISFFTCCR